MIKLRLLVHVFSILNWFSCHLCCSFVKIYMYMYNCKDSTPPVALSYEPVFPCFFVLRYSDKPSLIGAIQSVQYRGGSTATNFALRYAHYYQFAAYNGARVNAARIVIIMTDGHSNDASLTISEAMSLKVVSFSVTPFTRLIILY